ERDLAGLGHEEVVERLLEARVGEGPRGAGEELGASLDRLAAVGDALDEVAVEGGLRVGGPLLHAGEAHAFLLGDLLHRLQQVVDRLVAGGGDADALAAREQLHYEMRAGVGLAVARRALDEEGAAVVREDGGRGFVEERSFSGEGPRSAVAALPAKV